MRARLLTFVFFAAAAAVAAAACGAASDAVESPGRCGPPAGSAASLVHGEADLARLAGCAVVRGDLLIVGGAMRQLDALASLRRVEGSLRVGPTLRLTSSAGLGALEYVGGALEVAGNADLAGLYLGALVTVRGDVDVADNLSLSVLSLHRLERVGGSLKVQDNHDLFRVDLSSLRAVGGALEIASNATLEMVAVADHVTVSGTSLELEDNPRLPDDALEDLRARLSTSPPRPPSPTDAPRAPIPFQRRD